MKPAIFQSVFAGQWDDLPPVMQAHYAIRPYTSDRVTVSGVLDITMSPFMKFMAPLTRLLGLLTPWDGQGVPCSVDFLSDPNSSAFIFARRFEFPGHKPYVFRSKLVAKGAHDVIEYMACGVGWHCGYVYEHGRVVLQHKGFVWRLFGVDVPLPGANFFIGRGRATEEAIDDTHFRMSMALEGSLFGLMAYGYTGQFHVTDMVLTDD